MTEDRPPLPGYWQFLWMFWMQPVTLHHRLKACGIEEPDAPAWKFLLAAYRGGAAERAYLQKLAGVFTFALPLAAMLLVSLRAAGIAVRFETFAVGLAVGVAVGVAVGLALGVAFSVVFGVAEGVVLGVASGVSLGLGFGAREVGFGVIGDTAFGFTMGIALSAAMGAAGDLAREIASGVVKGVVAGVTWGVIGGVAVGIVVGVVWGIAWGVAWGVATILFYVRAPFYILEVLLGSSLYLWQRAVASVTLRASPVLHHDLSYFPHPFLAQHILLTADHDPTLVRRVLDACAISPGQGRTGQEALSQLQAREIEKDLRGLRFLEVTELRGTWLAGTQGADPLLLGFAEAARYLASAAGTSIPFQRLRKLELAGHQVDALRNRLRGSDSFLAQALRAGPLPVLEKVTSNLRHQAAIDAAGQLPNPFRVGEPLSLEEGEETFRGRKDLVRTIESLLGEPGRGASIALLGPRRCGKTSLLKMLPHRLPDAVCVLFDLQDNPIDSPAAFFAALERRTREQARRDRQIDLPRLPEGAPFEAGSRWLEMLDEQAAPLRILLCLDEFERLESLFPGSRQELLQVMGLLRATIQHRRRIRLLVSGAAPFDELDALWNDHLINVREVKIGYLDEETAVGLVRKPISDFPDEAVSDEVARAIVARTGGQPYLVQLYGSLLVTLLNEKDRRRAELADVPQVEKRALEQATYYLRNTYQEAPPAARAALLDLAQDSTPNLDAATRRWLRRRLLLSDEGRLSIPVLGAWLRAEEAE